MRRSGRPPASHRLGRAAALVVLLAACSPVVSTTVGAMRITSSAFAEGGGIPARYTCDGEDVSPPLAIEGVPAGTRTLALVVDDPDAPGGTWDHWVAFDIPVTDTIPEGVGELGVAGVNSWGRPGYGGPCPPRGAHRYVFTIYAVDTVLDLGGGASSGELRRALTGHVLGKASLTGTYRRR